MTILGRGAVGKPVVHPEDLSPDLALIGIRTCGLDHAGEFVPENRAGSSSPLRVCVVVYHCSSVGVTPAAWTRIRTSPRPGWGTGAVPAIRAGESKESLKRATFIAFVVSYSALEWLSRE